MEQKPLKHLRVTEATQSEVFRIQHEIALQENRRITQDYVLNQLITNYRKTHHESKKASKKGNR